MGTEEAEEAEMPVRASAPSASSAPSVFMQLARPGFRISPAEASCALPVPTLC